MEPYISRRDDFVRGMKHIEEEEEDHGGDGGNNFELDQLFLVHSDIRSVLLQIDELVVEATKRKTVSKHGLREVESFRFVLSDMLSSLKPWFPRLEEAISDFQLLPEDKEGQSLMSTNEEEDLFNVDSPEPTQFEPLVSPSPLVHWRGDHNTDKGRQLFLLTPLPLGKSEFLKHQNASKLTAKRIFPDATANESLEASKETSDDVLGGESMKTVGLGNSLGHDMDFSKNLVEYEPCSSPVLRRKIQSELLMTPCLKMSPPKSCTMFKPVPGSYQLGKHGACKSTCSELGASTSNGSQSSGSSGIETTDNLCSKYPELLGMQHAPITRKTDLESSPVWWFSPPKTCVLMEPLNEKKPIDETGGSRMVSSFDLPNINPEAKHTTDGSMSMVVESTPLFKEPESIMTKAGENTLKKELWTRFEEASIHDSRFSSMTTTTMRGNKQKEFMEMLEEVSGNEESQELNL
ncbi:hypothetical protein ISN45_Aa06g034830 [Arabidopsis thaliana x Arabidopsis arenosa]|uniref:Uncharacterized protein n=1 Tax=Arabidopsis thaliana x Arabidopsis arenosa TaxID=1240361 RepID=A0A8T1Z227_9BRAS|nr:hypothetical protein ISN45_Aa06g034830 [Arabidopsis thaliana x Arabidopsis arenosa]